MSPAVGRIVALVAAGLLAISLATSAWYAGHPTLEGKVFDRKTANIGLITASQCNFTDGEESDCKHLSPGGTFAITRRIELGCTALLALSLLLLLATGKKGFAKLVMISAAAAAVMSIVLLVSGPDLKTGGANSMPLGYGFYLFFAGTAVAIGSGVLSMLPAGKPKPRFAAPLPSQMPAQQAPAGFDVHALLAEDALRPSQIGPEPMMGRPQSPGGALPGPAGPLIPPSGQHQPLFQSAPQLRPLYETTGGGFTPPAPQQVQFPTRGPTPMPHAAVSAALGLDTPPPVIGPGRTAESAPPPPAAGQQSWPRPPDNPLAAAPRLPPPVRSKPVSVAPPIPSIPFSKRPPPPTTKPPPPSSPTKMSAVVPPPPQVAARAHTEEADLLQTTDYEKVLATGDSTDANALPFDTSTMENETKAFQNEEGTDVGGTEANLEANLEEDLETAARDKIDSTDENPPIARVSKTDVELLQRPSVSKTDVEVGAAPRTSTSVISSAAPPPRHTPSPIAKPPETKIPISTASESLPPPAEAAATGGPSPACPQCEAPMAWVEQHLRFFCKSCRMYF